ncbi:hypothetical protein VIGAN_UM009800, partial [Vigna angularis var. angularis]
ERGGRNVRCHKGTVNVASPFENKTKRKQEKEREEEGKREEFGRLKGELWVLLGGEILAAKFERGEVGAAVEAARRLWWCIWKS